MNSVPHPDSQWHRATEFERFDAEGGAYLWDNLNRGAKYYESKSIPVDTGIRWRVDEKLPAANSLCLQRKDIAEERRAGGWDPEKGGVYPNPPAWDYRPYIGFRGYSRNISSMGGMWAGFRYYRDETPPRVDFSPLCYEDVAYAMSACTYSRGIKGSRDMAQVMGHQPEMVLKIWIIREGEQPPPTRKHECWEPVRDFPLDGMGSPIYPDESIPEEQADSIKISCMWHMIRNKFMYLSGGYGGSVITPLGP